MPTYEKVDTVQACRQAVSRLEQEDAVAVDSEGVNLSATGPMTLLQIGTSDGHVFLFDVMREPRMFGDGGLKRLLESERLVKVLHSARNDDEALHAQHGVRLRHVHDTQLAQMELNRADGALFPARQKLEEICEIYCPQKAAVLKENKGNTQIKWNKTEGEYWAKRPLTKEMIQYAAYDVIAIIPEVYMAQKQLLAKRGLTNTFKLRVAQDLDRRTNDALREKLAQEDKQLVLSTLQDFANRTRRSPRLEDITDDNVLRALTWAHLDELNNLEQRRFLCDLKMQQMQSKLDEIETDMREKGDDFDPGSVSRLLSRWSQLLDEGPTKAQAQRLSKAAKDMTLVDMQTKYNKSTPAQHLSKQEQMILTGSIRPEGEHDPSVNPVLLALYWKVCFADLDDYFEKFMADQDNFTIREGYVKKLKFYVSGDVPIGLKKRGKEFLTALEEAGKVAPPQRGRGRGQGFRGGRKQGYYYR